MKQLKYISPSSLRVYENNREEFYLNYLADNRPPRIQQTQPMSIGSAFDARLKSYLYYILYGNMGPLVPINIIEKDNVGHEIVIEQSMPEYSFTNLFLNAVEPQNREWSLEASEWLFERYKESGALADLMIELQLATVRPRFEFDVNANIYMKDIVAGDWPIEHSDITVPVMGKPDLFFSVNDVHVTYDFKVNGFCGRSIVSPNAGYIKCRDATTNAKISRSHNQPHKNAQVYKDTCRLYLNVSSPFEDISTDWATQLCIYSWSLGVPIGESLIGGIEQCCGNRENMRFASFRGKISKEFQIELYHRLVAMWLVCGQDASQLIRTYFVGDANGGLTEEESILRCEQLDGLHAAFNPNDKHAAWLHTNFR